MTGHEFHEEEALGKAYDARLMGRLLTYLRPHRGVVAVATVLLIAMSLLELAGPFLTKIAIDRYIATGDTDGLLRIALLFFGTLVGAMVLGYAQTYIMQRMGQEIMLRLRTQIFAHLQRMNVGHFDRNPVGRLITRLTSDVEALNEMFTSGVVAIFGDLITLLGIMGVLLVINWKLALVAYAVLPLLFWLSLWFRNNVRENYRQVRIRLARINAFLQEAITGMSVLQIMNHEEQSRTEFKELNRSHADAHLRSIFFYATFYPMVEIISALALALVIWFGGQEIVSGAFTLGGLVAFIQYVRRFYRPIQDLSEKYNILQAAMASSERIFQLLDTEPAILDPRTPAASSRTPAAGAPVIEFRNVWFAYNEENWVLEDISFRVEKGESVAFVGATGSGKTTTMSLLLRFYDVQKGSVLVDGVDVREWPQRELRRRMSLVLQDVFLFSGSVNENVRMGKHRHHRPGRGERRPPCQRLRLRGPPSPAFRNPSRRAGSLAQHRTETTPLLCQSPRPRPGHPDPRRSHQQRGHRNRGADPGRPDPPACRPHVPGGGTPSLHGAECRPDPGGAPGPDSRTRQPPGIAEAARHLLQALSASVPGTGEPGQAPCSRGNRPDSLFPFRTGSRTSPRALPAQNPERTTR